MWSKGGISRGVFETVNFINANKFPTSRTTRILLHEFNNCMFRAGCLTERWIRKHLHRSMKRAIFFIESLKQNVRVQGRTVDCAGNAKERRQIICKENLLQSRVLRYNQTYAVLICGNKMPTRCNRCFLLQILSLAQHVSGTIMPIIRSSRVL